MPGWKRDGDFYTSNGVGKNGAGKGDEHRISSWKPPSMDEAEAEKNKVVPYQEPEKPSRRAFLERQIQDFIKQRPEDVAEVIKRWLREDQE